MGRWAEFPLTTPWILAKIGLLMAYVVATIAIRRGQTVKTRAQAYGVSIGILLTLFAVAGMKPSWGFLNTPHARIRAETAN